MSDWQKEFNDALADANIEKVLSCLSVQECGVMIDNSAGNGNTLNRAIIAMLTKPCDKFNLKFIEKLFALGSKMLIGAHNNILIVITKQCKEYLKKASINNNYEIAKKNIIDLLRLVINKEEFLPNSNVLIELMQTNNVEIIQLIIEASSKLWPDIFKKASDLIKPQIIEMILSHGMKPNVHHLELVIRKIIDNDNDNSFLVTDDDDPYTKCCEIMEIMCKHGAMINQENESDALSHILTHGVKTRIKSIVALLYKYGAKSNQSQTDENTLSCAVKTKNPGIVKIVSEYGAKPNQSQTDENTLSLAVETQDIQIIKMVCDSGGLPDVSMSVNNTLYLAMLTMDPRIILAIIQRGGVPTHGTDYWECSDENGGTYRYHKNIFHEMKNQVHKQKNDDQISRIIDLLMCSGAVINRDSFSLQGPYPSKKISLIDKKLARCYYLLNRMDGRNQYIIEHLPGSPEDGLKIELAQTMNQIEEDYLANINVSTHVNVKITHKKIIDQIDSAKIIPMPCIEIICGYLTLIRFIDWASF